MALDFPSSPTSGQTYNGYVYDSTISAWRSKGGAVAATYTSATAPSGPVNGDMWYNTSDGTTYIFYADGDSSQWVELRSQIATSQVGLVPIVPTSVSVGSGSASVSTGGLVTFTGVSVVNLNGVFSSGFARYRILLTMGDASSATSSTVRMNVRSGTTSLTTGYTAQGVQQTASNAPSAWNYTWTGAAVALCNLGQTTAAIEVYNPYTSGTRTTGSNTAYGWTGSAEQYVSSIFFTSSTSQYDGVSFDVSAGTAFGTLQVYGYR